MDYKTDKRIADIKTSISQDEIGRILKRPYFKVVRRENTPLWESLIQAGGALSDKSLNFDNPMKVLFALDYDKYASSEDFATLKVQFIESCKKDPHFLTEFFKPLEDECELFDLFIQKNALVDWSKVSNDELRKAYDTFVNYSLKILTFLWPPLAPEEWLVERISTEVPNQTDLHMLLGSVKPSLFQEREEAILTLAIKIKDVDGIERFAPEIEKTYKKYAWLNDHSLKFEYETKEHFIQELETVIKSGPKEKAKKTDDKERLMQRLSLSKETREYIHQASLLPHWRLLRTEKSIEAAYYLQGMFKEIGKRFDIDNALLCYYWEIGGLFAGKAVNKEQISRRKTGYGLVIMEDAIYDLDSTTRTAIKMGIESKIELGKIIKGNVACKGFVKGKVRILHNTSELGLFKDGEVLVTAMTTPEYVSIMKKALAIVTDEGGISCHAAIVSRELKIPCIIGTKNATKVLKTGDMVEVDAEKGIVRVIK
jgi:phosphohistidine swiveling domain-containing protein